MIKVELVLRDQEYDGEIPTVVVEALISHLQGRRRFCRSKR
jgi:hypothetical protein